MRRPQKFFEPYTDPKNSAKGPKKSKTDPKIKSKSKVRIKETIENRSCSSTILEPKPFLNHTPTPKIAH